jgi:hypothetical protein
MPICDECGRRFEAARSSKKYCSASCRQSAYVRRMQDEEDPEKNRMTSDPEFRGDFYGRIEELHQPEQNHSLLTVTDAKRDVNDDKDDANYVTASDANKYLTTANFHDSSYGDTGEMYAYELLPDNVTDAKNDANSVRSLSVISDANDAKHVTVNDGKELLNSCYSNYNTNQTMHNWDFSERKRLFRQRAEERAASKRSRADQPAEPNGRDQNKQAALLPVSINSRSDDYISPVTQDDASEHYQWIVPEFFKKLAEATDQRKQHVEWFAKQSASYYINNVNAKWTVILCKMLMLSWQPNMLTEFREVRAQMKELVDDFSFQSLPHSYPYKERIKRAYQNLEDLFTKSRVKQTQITVVESLQLEYYCILHELATAASSSSSLKLIK